QVHEDSSQEAEDTDLHTAPGRDDGMRAAHRLPGQVRWADDALARLHGGQDVGLAVDVVAQGHHVHAVCPHFMKEIGRDSAAGGDVLGVGDNQVDLALFDQPFELLFDDLSARPADDIPKTKDA